MNLRYLVFFSQKTMQGLFQGSAAVDLKFKVETKEHLVMLTEHLKEAENLYGQVSITGLHLVDKTPVKKPKNRTYTSPKNVLNGR